MKKLFILLLGMILVVSTALTSSAATEYVQVSAHPSIAAQPASGKYIQDLAYFKGEIYMGYGDWNANTGPIDIAAYDPATGLNSVKATVPTEAITVWREINGELYAPWTDPRVCLTCPGTFTTSKGGWHNVYGPAGQHWFDIAGFNGKMYVSGSISNQDGTEGGAAIYESSDGGDTWKLSINRHFNPPSGFERYYWMGVAGGRLYARAISQNYLDFPLDKTDGTTWSTSSSGFYGWSNANAVESYNGMIYAQNDTFDGRKSYQTGTPYQIRDFTQYGGKLYALTRNNEVYVTDGSFTGKGNDAHPLWTYVTNAPANSFSLVFADDYLYIGTTDGLLMKSTTKVITPTLSTPKRGK